ncbi:MAG: hypothetical protein KGK10_11840 [Rhodospirillales bacterium]|nr:hypothetical protein [Rhodospirillales bacterium]
MALADAATTSTENPQPVETIAVARLDVAGFLAALFPASPDAGAAEQTILFRPMGALFGLPRDITVAVTREVGAFG